MSIITLDIETLPSDNPALLEAFKASVQAPGQYKKPDSIAQWLAENRDGEAAAMLAKTGLDGLYGRVCVIGWAVDDLPAGSLSLRNDWDERKVIAQAFLCMDNDANDAQGFNRQLQVVGHNVEFDLRFLFHRAVRYGIPVPRCMVKAFGQDQRYAIHDTMRMWAGWKGYVKCRDLARELLGDPCDDIDGSQVAAAWAEDPAKVVTHCLADVERTRKLYRMMMAVL